MSTEDLHAGAASEDQPRRHFSTTVREVADEEIAAIRDVSFPIGMRGYDRAAVDAYVTSVNRIIAELQVGRSPQSAIRHALEQVSEETRGILERAHESADEIAGRSRSQAADRVDRAEQEARSIVAEAQARVRELDADAEAIAGERSRLIDDVRAVSEELHRLADESAARFAPEPAPPAEPEAETVPIDAEAVDSAVEEVDEAPVDEPLDEGVEEEPSGER